MAIDTTPSQVATSALQALPFSSLIGGPLEAAIEAQRMAAQNRWDFINRLQEGGAGTSPTPSSQDAGNVVFRFEQDGKTAELIIPLLTIVPIPDYPGAVVDMDVVAEIKEEPSGVAMRSDGSNDAVGYSVEYTMDIKVKASAADMPEGLLQVLDILRGSLTESGAGEHVVVRAEPGEE